MDSYATNLQQVHARQQRQLQSTPLWLKTLAARSNAQTQPSVTESEDESNLPHASDTRQPQQAVLRDRAQIARLSKVIEEPGDENGHPESPSLSSSARSTQSTAASVETAIRVSSEDKGSGDGSSSSNGQASISNDSDPKHLQSDSASWYISDDDSPGSWNSSVEGPSTGSRDGTRTSHSSRTSFTQAKKTRTARYYRNSPDSPIGQATTMYDGSQAMGSQPDSTLEESAAAPAPIVAQSSEPKSSENKLNIASQLKAAASTVVTKMKPGGSEKQSQSVQPQDHVSDSVEPNTTGIEGMIHSLGSREDGPRRVATDEESAVPGGHESTVQQAVVTPTQHTPRRPQPSVRETTRDGVPIRMRQRSGVWVENVEGADLTSTQDQQQNMPEGQPIAEREAEDVPEIQIPEDPWNNLPPYIWLENDNPGKTSSNAPRPATAQRRQQETEYWAREQVRFQNTGRPRRGHTRSKSGSDTRSAQRQSPSSSTQTRPLTPHGRGNNFDLGPGIAPYYYEKGKLLQNKNHPAARHHSDDLTDKPSSRSSSDKPSRSDSSPNTSLTTYRSRPSPSSKPVEIKGDPDTFPPHIQAKIAESAAAVEQLVYGLPRKERISARRFQIEGLDTSR